jgi:hypothetical protein
MSSTRISDAASETRAGAVLIIVVGISALLLVNALVFITYMRGSVGEVEQVRRTMQARIMLYAACNYIQESARIGWGGEAYGWIDPRDGSAGPRGHSTPAAPLGVDLGLPAGPVWPNEGGVVRAPMHVLHKPRYAIADRYAYNPTPGSSSEAQAQNGNQADFRRYARFGYADPWPAGMLPDYQQTGTAAQAFDGSLALPPAALTRSPEDLYQWQDDRPVAGTAEMAWFRVYRERVQDRDGDRRIDGQPAPYDSVDLSAVPAVFIVTCGAGGTRGYQDWNEVPAAERDFLISQSYFEELRRQEVIQWFRVEWAPNVEAGGNRYQGDLIRHVGGKRPSHEQAKDNWASQYLLGGMSIPQPPRDAHYPHLLNDRPYRYDLGRWERIAGGDLRDWLTSHAMTASFTVNQMGTIKWIQRLDGEPVRW